MKKYLLLFAFSALALSSCEDDDVQNYELDMLKGEWKTTKSEVISGKDNKTVLSTDIPTGCSAKSTTEFRIDYYAAYTAVTGVGTTCTSTKTEGSYTYNAENKELVIKLNNDNETKLKVIILSSTEMKLMTLSDNIDQNGDTVIDYTYISFVR
nr:lipocalin family protein [uncultured Chryseobacterium sp.]